jgi:hypothetical protein
MLETDKLRQSREIRDLRRKLRESRLSLPPAAYKALARHTLADPPTEGAPGAASPSGVDPQLEDEDEDEEDENQPPDPAYERCTALIEALIFRAKDAVQKTVVSSGPAPFKVLSPAEVELQYGSARNDGDGVEQGLDDRGAVEEGKSEQRLLRDDMAPDDYDDDDRDSSQESDVDVDGGLPTLPLDSPAPSSDGDGMATPLFAMNLSHPELQPPLEGSD